MEIAKSVAALRKVCNQWRDQGCKVGLVPTMGNLHDGHLSLLTKARELCDKTICSVYVNPLQFDQANDFEQYPNTLEQDIVALQTLGTDLVFVPDTSMIYPNGTENRTTVNVPGITDSLEGAWRDGHFTGVATVVCKLFNLAEPDVAVFGEKDFQQLLLVRRMTEDLNFPIEIVGSPTIRTPEGLAMSSRNGRLSNKERRQASEIYRTLKECVKSLRNGAKEFEQLELAARQRLTDAGFSPDYFSIRNTTDLEPAGANDNIDSWVVLVAANLGDVRLIDNMQVAE